MSASKLKLIWQTPWSFPWYLTRSSPRCLVHDDLSALIFFLHKDSHSAIIPLPTEKRSLLPLVAHQNVCTYTILRVHETISTQKHIRLSVSYCCRRSLTHSGSGSKTFFFITVPIAMSVGSGCYVSNTHQCPLWQTATGNSVRLGTWSKEKIEQGPQCIAKSVAKVMSNLWRK